MFVRVTHFRYDPARDADVVRLLEQDLVAALRPLPGFRRTTGGLDRAAGRGVFVSEWDGLQQAQAVRDAVGPEILRRTADAGVQLEPSHVFEVLVQA